MRHSFLNFYVCCKTTWGAFVLKYLFIFLIFLFNNNAFSQQTPSPHDSSIDLNLDSEIVLFEHTENEIEHSNQTSLDNPTNKAQINEFFRSQKNLNYKSFPKWISKKYFYEIYDLFIEGCGFAKAQFDRLGDKNFINRLKKNRLVKRIKAKTTFINETGLPQTKIQLIGRAEINMIDDNIVIRVVHKKTGISFLFSQLGSIDSKSKHYKLWLALQHQAAVRNVIHVELKNGLPVKITPYKIPRKFSREAFAEYYRIFAKSPKPCEDVFIAVSSTLMQLSYTIPLAILGAWLDPDRSFRWEIALPPIIFGLSVGFFNRFYTIATTFSRRTWSPIFKRFMRASRRATVGIMLNIGYMITMNPTGIAVLNPRNFAGIINWGHVVGNAGINQWIKDYFLEPVYIRDKIRDNEGFHTVNFFGYKKKVNKSYWQHQTRRILSSFIKTFELLVGAALLRHTGIVSSPEAAAGISMGLFGLSALGSQFYSYTHFKKELKKAQDDYDLNPTEDKKEYVILLKEEVAKLQHDWDISKNILLHLPKKAALFPFKFLNKTLVAPFLSYLTQLTSKKQIVNIPSFETELQYVDETLTYPSERSSALNSKKTCADIL